VFLTIGVAYFLRAERMRDWGIRMLQRRSYVIMLKVQGIVLAAIGVAMLFFGLPR